MKRSADRRYLTGRCLTALIRWVIATCAFAEGPKPTGSDAASVSAGWSKLENTAQPWTYWYWMGSAVDEAGITSPFQLEATAAIRPGKNHLEIEFADLPANRIAGLDRRSEDWKKFLFVDIRYRPFDASKWEPLASGLIGPVKLISNQRLRPYELPPSRQTNPHWTVRKRRICDPFNARRGSSSFVSLVIWRDVHARQFSTRPTVVVYR